MQWAWCPNFVKWDYNEPEGFDKSMHHAFDCVVIDPPFITPQVWAKYAQAALLLLSEGGQYLPLLFAEMSSESLSAFQCPFHFHSQFSALCLCCYGHPTVCSGRSLHLLPCIHANSVRVLAVLSCMQVSYQWQPLLFPKCVCLAQESNSVSVGHAGKIILSTIEENAEMLKGLLEVEPQLFAPSIPHLVYQYALFTNYPSTYLSSLNPELF